MVSGAVFERSDCRRYAPCERGAMVSVLEADVERDIYEDTFRLIVSSGEPEVVLRDAIFKNVCVISPKGVFVSEEPEGNS